MVNVLRLDVPWPVGVASAASRVKKHFCMPNMILHNEFDKLKRINELLEGENEFRQGHFEIFDPG